MPQHAHPPTPPTTPAPAPGIHPATSGPRRPPRPEHIGPTWPRFTARPPLRCRLGWHPWRRPARVLNVRDVGAGLTLCTVISTCRGCPIIRREEFRPIPRRHHPIPGAGVAGLRIGAAVVDELHSYRPPAHPGPAPRATQPPGPPVWWS